MAIETWRKNNDDILLLNIYGYVWAGVLLEHQALTRMGWL